MQRSGKFHFETDFQLKVRQLIRNRIHSSQLRFNLDYFSAFIWLSFLIVSRNGFSLWNNLVINKQKQLLVTKQIQVSLNLFERLQDYGPLLSLQGLYRGWCKM